MALFVEFLGQQWMLASAVLVCFVLLMKYESQKGGASLSPQQMINKVNKEQAVVIDLRDKAEFKAGHIVDAINIPSSSFATRLGELEPYRDRPIVLVCKMGQHSGAAGKQLSAAGFEQVFRLSGGMMEWKSMQLPEVS
ncbi:rhodanese-like domain-containing protein [Dasania sp. GY-MA-18]|uniref:Rhodanese-like domain-containing protein n=1 Tax=Dasania phycosphaerae TaxID=2950436 RepID=A0A9J6RLS9_9GAMM|nr:MULTISPECIES: rhodanese-like domain-containing protein [Dasania]MCR8923036.1 rhodanese-like domain-containing protein [Dasania sp. GY-MA-18]MCZ0865467.1 rhodanese-like domain-containing protein [Dasania phycosphaerae]MCZ0869192.1 rhodanese-like domain-containing protein [Dasania phycosphaerae]